MLRAPVLRTVHAVLLGGAVIGGSAWAQDGNPPGTLSDMPLPGGLRQALAAVDDRAPADRSQFLLEYIRRSYRAAAKAVEHDRTLRTLIAHLERMSNDPRALTNADTLPLPLTPQTWIDVVFRGRATRDTLALSILQSRNAAMLYQGLLSLDDATRAWIERQPELLRDVAASHASAFVIAAPALRVVNGVVMVPGGEPAVAPWEALIGRPANNPSEFVRALLSSDDGRHVYLFGAMAELTLPQIRYALNLDAPDATQRTAAVRTLDSVFERVAIGHRPDEWPLLRSTIDPGLLVADLAVDEHGQPILPGNRRFWTMVFDGRQQDAVKAAGTDASAADRDRVSFAWLCDQIFKKGEDSRRRYRLVLFASRVVARVHAGNERDAIAVVRACERYPALTATLERAKVTDLRAFAAAARRADQLSKIDDVPRARRSLAQFQGALALLTRAAQRGRFPAKSIAGYVSSLSAVETSERGDYEGRILGWLDAFVTETSPPDAISEQRRSGPFVDSAERVAGSLDQGVLRAIAGPAGVEPRFVDWEGTRYRVDLATPEALRLERLMGERPLPYLSAAQSLLAIADVLEQHPLTTEALRAQVAAMEQVAGSAEWDDPVRWKDTDAGARASRALSALQRLARAGGTRDAPRLASSIRVLADDLVARGLLQITYAAALGHPDRIAISADTAASRHDFGFQPGNDARSVAWRIPVRATDRTKSWSVTGSLLGLDVTLAEFSLVRLSSRPPARRPTLNDEDRRVLIENVALVDPLSLADSDRDAIVSAIHSGRERLAALRTREEASAVADQIRLGSVRRSLLPWVLSHEPARAGVFLSPSELLWLGLGAQPLPAGFHAWGAPAEPRLVCLCLQLPDRRPWELLAGRGHFGMLASGFPDLNLRLAELLGDLQMPAALLGPVLAPATQDLVDGAISRDPDDHRSLVDFVLALRREKVEQYLALLTTDGPLVPSDDAAASRETAVREVRR